MAARSGRSRLGGAPGNARLTSLTGAVLIVLLALEGATIPFIGPLLSVHIFVGMLLIGPVALKLASTGYRFGRFYGRAPDYVLRGPPAPLMRILVAPVLVLSTLTLFGSGVLLVATPHRGAVLGLHKASFVVWFAACGIHVLVYAARMLRHVVVGRLDGEPWRTALVVAAIGTGVVVALATYPLAGTWLHALGSSRHVEKTSTARRGGVERGWNPARPSGRPAGSTAPSLS